MIALFCLCLALFVSPFKSKSRLEAENAALRHQLIILRRKVRGRVRLSDGDRLFFIQLYRWFPTILKAYQRDASAGLACGSRRHQHPTPRPHFNGRCDPDGERFLR